MQRKLFVCNSKFLVHDLTIILLMCVCDSCVVCAADMHSQWVRLASLLSATLGYISF